MVPVSAPDVVTCMISTRMSPSGKPFEAVFKMYHDAPVSVLLNKVVAPSVRKNGVMGCPASSTTAGSAAPAMPEAEAGPSSPTVA